MDLWEDSSATAEEQVYKSVSTQRLSGTALSIRRAGRGRLQKSWVM